MRKLENENRWLKHETAYIFDRNGNLFKADGNVENVNLEHIDLTNAVITHNHPNDEMGLSDSFGKDDFEFLQYHPEIKELRAVNTKYNYRLRMLRPLNLSYHEANNGGYEYAVINGNYDEPQHNAMRWLKEKGYIMYTRKRIR